MALKHTPFYRYHLDHGAKLVDFAGWQMPIHYGSIIAEHRLVRSAAGIFDVSHMGRIEFRGRHARRFLERILTRRISDMPEKSCRYALICNEAGGTLDDVIVYRFDDRWLLVVNAANRLKLLDHFQQHRGDLSVKIDDQTEKLAMVAIQGPKTMDFVTRFSKEIPTLSKYTFTIKNLLVLKMIVSRTGYTGEDGIELMLPGATVGMAMKLLMQEDEHGDELIKPIGLGARDTLRLEAGMPLYGHELTESIDPLTAGLKFAVSLDKHQDDTWGEAEKFIGQDAIQAVADAGPSQKRIGLKLDGKRTARQQMPILLEDKPIGHLTSGCLSPTLGHPIAMGYVDTAHAEVGQTLAIDFGKQQVSAEVVKLPFYKRG
jgi:aminomethyltransferase